MQMSWFTLIVQYDGLQHKQICRRMDPSRTTVCMTVSSDLYHMYKRLLLLLKIQDNTVHYLPSPLCWITHDSAFEALWHHKWHFNKVVPSAAAAAGLWIQSTCLVQEVSDVKGQGKGNADEKSVGSDVHISERMEWAFPFWIKVSVVQIPWKTLSLLKEWDHEYK